MYLPNCPVAGTKLYCLVRERGGYNNLHKASTGKWNGWESHL